MTALEDRLRDLATPTEPGAPEPSRRQVELDAAARRHRHRSVRVLAIAAALFVVVGLAVVVVRRPQPAVVDLVDRPSVTTPDTLWPTTGTSIIEATTAHPSAVDVLVLPLYDSASVDVAVQILRQRLDAIGMTGSVVSLLGGDLIRIRLDWSSAPNLDWQRIGGTLTADLPMQHIDSTWADPPPP